MQTLDDIRPGQTIGRYEFLVPIAKGGMAGVWAARLKGTRGFAKTVAIKTMLPTLSDDPLFEQMFLDEAQIAAQIHHPNVVEIMDLGEQEDVLYQVMEYVDGESMATILRAVSKKKERMPVEIAVRVVTDALRGLHAAHELKSVDGTLMGLVHRDISPQNIMLTYDGVVKLVDFGVAKAAGRTASETTAGQIKGKAPYMAPEQALGQRVDRRTDLFAMGIVLYQITTGKHPFRGENDIATLHNILHKDVPSPRFVDPKFPRPLEAVINRALSREVEKRFPSAKDMADALARVFPPTHRRIDVADVGNFVQDLLGETGNRRRTALAESIKRADQRVVTGPQSESSGGILLPLADIDAEESSVNGPRALGAPTERINIEELAGRGRASHPGLSPIMDLADRLSAPPTLDFDEANDHRNAETMRPGVRSPSAPDAPAFDAGRGSLPGEAGATSLEPESGAPSSDGTPGTAPAAMVSLPDIAEPQRNRSGLKIAAFIGGAVIVGVGVGITAWSLLRPPQEDGTAAVAAPTSVESASPAASADKTAELLDAADPNAPVYDLEAVSEPVEEPDAEAVDAGGAAPAVNHVRPTATKTAAPVESAAPPPTKTAPPATAAPESTWKPPPVADPGF
jgi:serine/threonine protein kinase